ncbi:MAG: hypothetical protein ABJB85_10110 [Nitrososphaerota archaeon]
MQNWRHDLRSYASTRGHELRISTDIILKMLEMIKRSPEMSSEYLAIIEKNAKRLYKLSQDMHDPTDDQFVIKGEKINLVEEITDLVQRFAV